MNLTRNTRLYKAISELGNEVVYRTLNVTEVKMLDNINSPFHKNEMAYKIAVTEDNYDLNFFEIQQIGRDVINNSVALLDNPTLYELTVDELRSNISDDPVFTLISHIMNGIPGVSVEYLLSLTYEDLMELAAFTEQVTNKKIFNIGQKKQATQQQGESNFFADDGKSLQEKMKEMQDF